MTVLEDKMAKTLYQSSGVGSLGEVDHPCQGKERWNSMYGRENRWRSKEVEEVE